MTDQELNAIAKGIVPVMRQAIAEAIVAATVPLVARIMELEAKPQPRDGRDGLPGVAGPAGERGEQGERGETGEAGPLGRAGDRGDKGLDGERGERGERGEKGEPGDTGPIGVTGEKGLDGKDGSNGLNGKDGAAGLGFDDFDLKMSDDGRSIIHTYTRGELVKSFTFPVGIPQYRGVWTEQEYQPGDMVTRGGSCWFAKVATKDTPGDNSKSWVLAVKRGGDGKPGRDGKDGAEGKEGPRGRDLTQLGPDGRKW